MESAEASSAGIGDWTIHYWRHSERASERAGSLASAVAMSLWAVLHREYWTEAIVGPDGSEIRRPELSHLWRSYRHLDDED